MYFGLKTLQNQTSKFAILLVTIVFLLYRGIYFENNKENGYNATSWDAFGYYMYLPSIFIYGDVKELKWIPEVDSIYHVTGGSLYQAIQLESGTYTNKYFSGIAVMQAPFFFAGHAFAKMTDVAADGFSAPYQYAILFGAIFWVVIGLVYLRKVLKVYFSEEVVALTILFLGLSSNLIQYTAIDGGMSHAFIFPLYSILLWHTLKWHEKPSLKSAIFIGGTIGLATISRPTELIMIFIPLLWNVTSKETRQAKWKTVWAHKSHVVAVFITGIIAMSPQFVYWYYTTGKLIFNVGSKWYFFNPWFRVLVGPEKGWFLYTPVALMMIAGFFFMRGRNFKRAIITFCLLTIWIVIAWSDWRYGASYSTRALVQSYPVFAVSMACFSHWAWNSKWKWSLIGILVIFIILNFYQLTIYNNGIIESFSPLIPY